MVGLARRDALENGDARNPEDPKSDGGTGAVREVAAKEEKIGRSTQGVGRRTDFSTERIDIRSFLLQR